MKIFESVEMYFIAFAFPAEFKKQSPLMIVVILKLKDLIYCQRRQLH